MTLVYGILFNECFFSERNDTLKSKRIRMMTSVLTLTGVTWLVSLWPIFSRAVMLKLLAYKSAIKYSRYVPEPIYWYFLKTFFSNCFISKHILLAQTMTICRLWFWVLVRFQLKILILQNHSLYMQLLIQLYLD